MIPDSHRNQRKIKGLKLAIMDRKIAQAGFKIKKWEIILNDNSSRDQKEPFLLVKMEKKGEKKFGGPNFVESILENFVFLWQVFYGLDFFHMS